MLTVRVTERASQGHRERIPWALTPKPCQVKGSYRNKLVVTLLTVGALENECTTTGLQLFVRYYSDGDFLPNGFTNPSLRCPYEGEEVKLHWADRDQYYVKTVSTTRLPFRLRPPTDDTNPSVAF